MDPKPGDAAELHRVIARTDRGRSALDAVELPYPGGDACPARVVCGLAKLRTYWDVDGFLVTSDPDVSAALAWIAMWVEAGAAMLPKKLR